MDKLIDGINIIDSNLQHLTKIGEINGTLRSEIKRVMSEYAQQQVENLTIPVVVGSFPSFDKMKSELEKQFHEDYGEIGGKTFYYKRGWRMCYSWVKKQMK